MMLFSKKFLGILSVLLLVLVVILFLESDVVKTRYKNNINSLMNKNNQETTQWKSREQIEKYILVTWPVYQHYVSYICDSVEASAAKYNLDRSVVLAIIQTESGFQYNAVSCKNCVGLMQINTAVWKDELQKNHIIDTPKDLYDPANNIEAGCFILNRYLKKSKGNLESALFLYFGMCSKEYSGKVLTNFAHYKLIDLSVERKGG